jgi:hypothetical protein
MELPVCGTVINGQDLPKSGLIANSNSLANVHP